MIIDPRSAVPGIFAGAYTKPPMLYIQRVLKQKDARVAHHSIEVAAHSIRHAQEIGFDHEYVQAIGAAGLLHSTVLLVGGNDNLDERLAREQITRQRDFIEKTAEIDSDLVVNMISAMHRYTGRDARKAYESTLIERRCIDPVVQEAGQVLAANCIYHSLKDRVDASVLGAKFWQRFKGDERYGSLVMPKEHRYRSA